MEAIEIRKKFEICENITRDLPLAVDLSSTYPNPDCTEDLKTCQTRETRYDFDRTAQKSRRTFFYQ